MKLFNKYIGLTERRKELDRLQKKYQKLYRGKVLDIGGRDRGEFTKPKKAVKEWVFADINPEHKPDIVLDVTDMKKIKDESFDTVLAMEVFEHVYDYRKGFKECYRVLKKGGYFIFSVPFLYPIHADPYDYVRLTKHQIDKLLQELGMKEVKVEVTGGLFVVLSNLTKIWVRKQRFLTRIIAYLFYPLLSLLVKFDKPKKEEPFAGGYFVVAKK